MTAVKLLKFAGWMDLHDLCRDHRRLSCGHAEGACKVANADEKWKSTKSWKTSEATAKENELQYELKSTSDFRSTASGVVHCRYCRYYTYFPLERKTKEQRAEAERSADAAEEDEEADEEEEAEEDEEEAEEDEEEAEEDEDEAAGDEWEEPPREPKQLPRELIPLRQNLMNHQDALLNEVLRRINGERSGGFRSRLHRVHAGTANSRPLKPLKFCPKLMQRARELWHKRICFPDGFLVLPHNMVISHEGKRTKRFGCLTYFTPRFQLEWLPLAMVEFWLNRGMPMPALKETEAYSDFPSTGEFYAHSNSTHAFAFYRMSSLFPRQLMSRKCRRMGLYIDMAREFWPDQQNLVCAVAVFDVPTHPATEKLVKAAIVEHKNSCRSSEKYYRVDNYLNCNLP